MPDRLGVAFWLSFLATAVASLAGTALPMVGISSPWVGAVLLGLAAALAVVTALVALTVIPTPHRVVAALWAPVFAGVIAYDAAIRAAPRLPSPAPRFKINKAFHVLEEGHSRFRFWMESAADDPACSLSVRVGYLKDSGGPLVILEGSPTSGCRYLGDEETVTVEAPEELREPALLYSRWCYLGTAGPSFQEFWHLHDPGTPPDLLLAREDQAAHFRRVAAKDPRYTRLVSCDGAFFVTSPESTPSPHPPRS